MSKTKTTGDLRDILFATISDVRSGKMEASDAAQVAKLSREINDSARVDLEFARAAKELSPEGTHIFKPQLLSNEPETESYQQLESEDELERLKEEQETEMYLDRERGANLDREKFN